MKTVSAPFNIQIIAPSTTASPFDSRVPPLTQIIALNGDRWSLDTITGSPTFGKAILNGVPMTDKQQPNSATILYVNTRDATWLKTVTYPDAIWVKGPHGYAYWNGTVFGFAGHGPDAGKV